MSTTPDVWTHTPNDPRLKAEELEALARVVIIWGHIEADIQHVIWEYMGGDAQIGASVTAGMPLDAKLRLLRELAKTEERKPDLVDRLNALLNRIDILRPLRNDLIHGYWVDARPHSYRKIIKEGRHPWDTNYSAPKIDILDFSNQSSALCHELWRFMGFKLIDGFQELLEPPDDHLRDPTSF